MDDKRGRVGDGAYYESWPPDANQHALGVLVQMGRKKREDVMGKTDYCCKYIWPHLLQYIQPLRDEACQAIISPVLYPRPLFSTTFMCRSSFAMVVVYTPIQRFYLALFQSLIP